MASGDASRTWFSEMVEVLRRGWKPDMPWEEIIALRDCLDTMLQQIRLSRGVRPPTMWCSVCNQRTRQAPPTVSVRAVIFALGRFAILPRGEVQSLEKRWAKHRKQNSLDRNGKSSEAITGGSNRHRPARHSHSPTYAASTEAAPERHPQEAEPQGGGSSRVTRERRPR